MSSAAGSGHGIAAADGEPFSLAKNRDVQEEATMKWNIVTDSSCDRFPAVMQSGLAQLSSVPFVIRVGDRDFVDDDALDTVEMLDAMERCEQASHTSCPAPHDWLERFEQAEQSIAITISSRLSGSMISAELARETALGRWPEKRIAVLDSRSTGPELVLCVFSVLSFSFGKRSVLSFLSEKEKKEPKKRTLNGEGDERKQSGGPPRSVRFPSIGRPPRLALPIFPCGAFL